MSKKFETVKYYFTSGVWSENQVKNAVRKEWITREEYETITGKKYTEA